MDHTNPGAPLVEISVEVGAIKCLGLSTDLSIRNRCDSFDGLWEFCHPLVLQSCIDLLLGLVDGRFCRFQITFPCFTLRKHVGMGGRLLEDSGHSVERGHGLRGMHDASQGVIVPSWNRVEFVVMATSTTDGLAQEGFSDGVELLVDNVGPHFGFVRLGQNFGTEAEKSGGHDAVTGQVTIVGGRKQIPSQLHGEELVVGEIVVEGADHPVPPTPSIGEGRVLVKPIRVRVSRHVHPVSSPPFAVVGGLQQLIKRLVQSFNWRGMFKIAELLEGWGQSRQGQMKTPQQLVVFGR